MQNKNLFIYALLLKLFIFYFIHFVTSIHLNKNELKKSTIKIQGYSPEQNDDYVAVMIKAEPGYIVKFEPAAHADRVHHMLLYGCTTPAYSDKKFWKGGATCSSGNHILYAWARNAPPLVLPENVGFAIGNDGDAVQYIVLQIHYAKQFEGNVIDFSGVTLHLSNQKPHYIAGVYLFVSGMTIQPENSAFYTNVSCSYNSDTKLYPFAFRTHTHEMGRIVSAYVKKAKTKKWLQIGKRNPLWPQLFQMRETPLVIENGDFLAATCRYDSSDKTEEVPMGSMGTNEMCNFYMMYYQDRNDVDPFPYGSGCFGNSDASFVANEYPEEGTKLLPPHPELEHQANHSTEPFGVLERHRIEELDDVLLGQVAGLTFDQDGNLVVFHRAGRFWDQNTFNENNVFTDKTPIDDPVILIVDTEDDENPKILAKYGKKRFYLPHGIFVDHNGFIYTTDVGSHQVIKWRIKNGEIEQVWSLGVKFVPGSDKNHFCKPAGVVVSKLDGSIYVADGYCNNRVVKFSSGGHFISQFGEFNSGRTRLGQFSLPHDITLDEQGGHIFVADRENGRTQAFSIYDHKPLFDIKNPNFYSTVYSVYYQQGIGLLFVPGFSPPTQDGKPRQIQVYVVQPNSTHIQYAFRPQSGDFQLPHVLRADGNNVWVGEIAGSRGVLWHFEIHSSKIAPSLHASQQKKGGTKLINGNESQKGKLENGVPSPLHPQSFATRNFAIGSTLVFIILLSSMCFAFYLIYWSFCHAQEQDLFDKQGFKPLKNSDLADVEQDFTSSDSEDEILEGSRKKQESGF
uniref:Peptidylglycine monooxygenase n=2 Tax=Meloidogyne hapla TaxID=6305 RepID=A0A1I8BAJ1_MELHA